MYRIVYYYIHTHSVGIIFLMCKLSDTYIGLPLLVYNMSENKHNDEEENFELVLNTSINSDYNINSKKLNDEGKVTTFWIDLKCPEGNIISIENRGTPNNNYIITINTSEYFNTNSFDNFDQAYTALMRFIHN